MPSAPLPATEPQRLARLRALGLLDTPCEPLFDDLARLAAQICGTPIALMSLVDEDRQWFKANVGLEGTAQTAREAAFCAHAILNDTLMEVPDAQADPRFADNPLVLGNPHIRFYAGAPLDLGDANRIGTLCIIDRVPRRLETAQREALQALARTVSAALLMREQAMLAALSAERAVVDSERKFRELADHSPLGVFHTTKEGLCTYTNASWQRMYGLGFEEALGEGWSSTLHPEDRTAIFTAWNEAADAGRDFDMAFRVQHRDGTVRHLHALSRALVDDKGTITGHVGKVEDITARWAIEEQVRQHEAMLNHAAVLAGVGVWRLQVEPELAVWWNAQTCRIHDRPVDHTPQLDEAIEYYEPQARDTIREAVRQAIEHGTPFELELPMRTATGRSIWVRSIGEAQQVNGRTVRLMGAFQDVTQRRQREAALSASMAQLSHLYNQTPALLLSVDESGRIQAGSDRLLQRLGTTRERWVSSQLASWIKPEQRRSFARLVMNPLFSAGRVDNVSCTLRTVSGDELEAKLSARLEYGDNPSVRRAMVSLEDVTETARRTRELQEEQGLRRQIERHALDLADLLTERSEMLNVLAHEVRQPLNNASAALQGAAHTLLRQRGPAALEAAEPLHRAQRVLGSVMAGVDNALAVAALLAEGHGATAADVDLDLLISIAIGDMPLDDRSRIRVTSTTTARTITADAGLMRLALRNLLANALAFSPQGAPVEVRLSEAASGANLCIDVIDHGPGIDPDVQGRLFQRGARGPAHERRGSHGLGLYIVRRAMELQGGHAQLLYTGPQGTAIRLELNEEASALQDSINGARNM